MIMVTSDDNDDHDHGTFDQLHIEWSYSREAWEAWQLSSPSRSRRLLSGPL